MRHRFFTYQSLGRMYEKGWISGGVEKAIAKYKEAAARGVPEACEKLGPLQLRSRPSVPCLIAGSPQFSDYVRKRNRRSHQES